MSMQTVRIADSLPPEPAMSSDYFNAKYKAWLRRRGFEDEAQSMDRRMVLGKRNRAKQLGNNKGGVK
jgi:hypothetical protein